MVYACFSYFGKSDLAFLSERFDAKNYIATLETNLFPIGALTHGESLTFQQHNAPIRTASKVKQYFSSKGVNILAWPAKSPDLNPIENL